MTSNPAVSLIVVVASILSIAVMIQSRGLPSDKQSVVVGTVIAYDQLVSLTNITSAPQSQLLLLRIEKRIRGREHARYIKVVYKYNVDETSLPEAIFDGKSQWRFILKRDRNCDSSVGKMKAAKHETMERDEVTLPHLKFTSDTEGLADKTNLPCYVLKPGHYRLQK